MDDIVDQGIQQFIRDNSIKELQHVLAQSPSLLEQAFDNDDTLLCYAIRHGSIDMMEYLMDKGADLRCVVKGNDTAFHITVATKDIEKVKLFVTKFFNGIMWTHKNDFGDTPYLTAARYPQADVLEYLIDLIDKSTVEVAWSVLKEETLTDQDEQEQEEHQTLGEPLNEIKYSFTDRDYCDNTMLHLLAQEKAPAFAVKQTEIMKSLMDRGLNLNDENNEGINVIMTLVQLGNFNCLKYFYEFEAKEKGRLELLKNEQGVNIVHVCCEYQSLHCLKEILTEDIFNSMLVERVLGGSKEGSSSLHFACKNRSSQLCLHDKNCVLSIPQCNIRTLLRFPGNEFKMDETDAAGRTCLTISKERGLVKDIYASLEHSADVIPLIDCIIYPEDFPDKKKANAFVNRLLGLSKINVTFTINSAIHIMYEAFKIDSKDILKNIMASDCWAYVKAETFQSYFVKYLLIQCKDNPLLPDLNNGFARELEELPKLQNLDTLPLLGIAVKTGRLELAKQFVIARQLDLIPSTLKVILECLRLRQRDVVNHHVIDLQDYCETILMNALDELYLGADKQHRELIYKYLEGKMCAECHHHHDEETMFVEMVEDNKDLNGRRRLAVLDNSQVELKDMLKNVKSNNHKQHHNSNVNNANKLCQIIIQTPKENCVFPNTGCICCCTSSHTDQLGPVFHTFDLEEENNALSVMKLLERIILLAEISGDYDETKFKTVFVSTCFKDLIEWRWNSYIESVQCCIPHSKGEAVFSGRAVYSLFQFILDFIFIGLYTIYLLVCMSDFYPTHSYDSFYSAAVNNWNSTNTDKITWVQNLLLLQRYGWIIEMLLLLYWLGLLIEEIVEYIHDRQNLLEAGLPASRNVYFTFLNVLDLIYLILFISAFIGKVIFYLIVQPPSIPAPGQPLEYQQFLFRLIFGMAYTILCYRRMYNLGLWFKNLGILYITLTELITKDLIPFFLMFSILIFSCGTFFHCLLTPGGYRLYGNGTVREHNLINLISIYVRPLLVSFGEYGKDNLDKCFSEYTMDSKTQIAEPSNPESSIDTCTYPLGTFLYSKIFMFIFILVVNLTLFNLLIARFSMTVDRYNEAAVTLYFYNLYLKHKAILVSGCLPAPLNILSSFKCVIKCLACKNKVRPKAGVWHDTEDPKILQQHVDYLDFLHFQAAAFSGKRVKFTDQVFDAEVDVEKAAMKLQYNIKEHIMESKSCLRQQGVLLNKMTTGFSSSMPARSGKKESTITPRKESTIYPPFGANLVYSGGNDLEKGVLYIKDDLKNFKLQFSKLNGRMANMAEDNRQKLENLETRLMTMETQQNRMIDAMERMVKNVRRIRRIAESTVVRNEETEQQLEPEQVA